MRREDAFTVNGEQLVSMLNSTRAALDHCHNNNDILAQEAKLTKALYKIAVNTVKYGDFTRSKRGSGTDFANRFLDHGNYLAYGLGATAAWVLGLPHGLAVLHGKTRRGGLVFDIADLIKDALILPQAFIAAMQGEDEQEFRRRCTEGFNQAEALDVMIDTVKDVAVLLSEVGK
jgi:CRISPR-associated protein Cas1